MFLKQYLREQVLPSYFLFCPGMFSRDFKVVDVQPRHRDEGLEMRKRTFYLCTVIYLSKLLQLPGETREEAGHNCKF